jgi:cytochrome c peroxidase
VKSYVLQLVPLLLAVLLVQSVSAQANGSPSHAELEAANPARELPTRMVGHEMGLDELDVPPDMLRARLGRWLFYDTRLSADGTISCATCHLPAAGFSQPTPVSTGIRGQMGGRKAPSFLNAAFANFPETFWDGRAADLEDQAKGPIENPIEMGETHAGVVAKIAAAGGYRAFFEEAFGDSEVTIDRVATAIADYERTRLSGNSRVDQWNEWDPDTLGYDDLLTDQEILGNDLFFDKAKCSNCHSGPHFTDSQFHNIGVGWDPQTEVFADEGRVVVTGDDADRGAFKTPGLREVHLHAPYMHDGSIATLREVVDHYVNGAFQNPSLSDKMEEVDLTDEEIDALVAFMEALAGEGYSDNVPVVFPR